MVGKCYNQRKHLASIWESAMTTDQNIKNIILDMYLAFENTDESAFRALAHPEMRTVNIGNENKVHVFKVDQICENTINGLKYAKESVPGFFARWEGINFIDVTVGDVVAFVSVNYKMKMPESLGKHTSGIHLVKPEGKWQVIQIVDRGIEQAA
jgi:hypothetical protein